LWLRHKHCAITYTYHLSTILCPDDQTKLKGEANRDLAIWVGVGGERAGEDHCPLKAGSRASFSALSVCLACLPLLVRPSHGHHPGDHPEGEAPAAQAAQGRAANLRRRWRRRQRGEPPHGPAEAAVRLLEQDPAHLLPGFTLPVAEKNRTSPRNVFLGFLDFFRFSQKISDRI
jgi:hypothetical protein